jgi:diguanylate cyclase (GGDEF)-like protein
VTLAETTGKWTPASGRLKVPQPPKLLRETELEVLGARIVHLADTASGKIREVEESRRAVVESNTELSQKSENLSQAVAAQNRKLQLANDRLKELAERDSLTGLYNRRSFDRMAAEAFAFARAKGQQVSVLLLDVDNFKAYNDFYGHQAGDDCLTQISAILEASAEDDDIFVARFGGEEFVAMVLGRSAEDAERYANTIHDLLLESRIEHQRSTLADRITISIGGASIPAQTDNDANDDSGALDRLISAADEALYEAKRSGRNKTVFSTPAIRESVSRKRLEARKLLDAIETRAFEPYFQPQIDASTGHLIGLEALVRWRQPDGKIVTPYAFLDTATENGFVQLIDRIVLEGVADFLKQAKALGFVVPRISLNSPRENLTEPRYVQDVIALAKSSGVPISLELLETAIFDTPDDALMWQLDSLRDAGIEIEIDDFGTGHTSIVSLMSLAPSRLKIAKELVMPMLESEAHERIVSSVIQISEALKIDVLAEGIESAEVSARLVDLGCNLQQGYHFARPMPAEDLFAAYGAQSKGKVWLKAG